MENNRLFLFWRSSSMRDFHVLLGVISVGLNIAGKLSGNTNWQMQSELIALFAIFHFLIHGYFYKQQRFVSDNQKVYSLPKQKIARIGGIYLSVFLVLAGIGIAFARELAGGTLFEKLRVFFLYIFATIFRAFLSTDGLGKDKLMVRDDFSVIEGMNQIAQKGDSPWEKFLNNLQSVLIIAGVVILLVVLVMLFVNYIRKLTGNITGSVIRTGEQSVSDLEERIASGYGKRESIFDFSPSARARRLYRKEINRNRRRGQNLPDHMTPAEIEEYVALESGKRSVLHSLYEKARYSQNGCTDEDVKTMKMAK